MKLHINATSVNFFQERIVYMMNLVLTIVMGSDNRINCDWFEKERIYYRYWIAYRIFGKFI